MSDPKIDRWSLFTDTLIFQVKLGMDAIRDLLLSPVSILFAVIDLFIHSSHKHSLFYNLMKIGHKSDTWINLFGTRNRQQKSQAEAEEPLADLTNAKEISCASNSNTEPKNIDQLFSQVETLIKEQHDKGGLTASAKASIDKYLDKIISNTNNKPQL